jgi:hypothetical protein
LRVSAAWCGNSLAFTIAMRAFSDGGRIFPFWWPVVRLRFLLRVTMPA